MCTFIPFYEVFIIHIPYNILKKTRLILFALMFNKKICITVEETYFTNLVHCMEETVFTNIVHCMEETVFYKYSTLYKRKYQIFCPI